MTATWKFIPPKLDPRKVIHDALADGVLAGAERLLAASNGRVPVQSGVLRQSGRVTGDGERAAVAYGAPYAAIVHEDMTAHHDDGQAKFLESSMGSEARPVAEGIAAAVRRRT